MAATLRGVIGLNVLQLVALESVHEADLARIPPQVLVVKIVLALDLTPRQGIVTMEVVQVKK